MLLEDVRSGGRGGRRGQESVGECCEYRARLRRALAVDDEAVMGERSKRRWVAVRRGSSVELSHRQNLVDTSPYCGGALDHPELFDTRRGLVFRGVRGQVRQGEREDGGKHASGEPGMASVRRGVR